MNRILVVDDEPAIRFALRQYFSQRGFAVDCAGTATEARALIAFNEYVIAILDLHLTGRSGPIEGVDLAAQLRRYAPETGIIILTGSSTAETEQRVAEMGVHSFLRKPARLAQVAEVALGLVRDRLDLTTAPSPSY
jgi:two-component system response regulator BasR